MSDPFMPADDRYGNEIIERLQARLTAAEKTRDYVIAETIKAKGHVEKERDKALVKVRKLEELLLRAIHFIDPSCPSKEGWYHSNTSMAEYLTGEFDKLKETK